MEFNVYGSIGSARGYQPFPVSRVKHDDPGPQFYWSILTLLVLNVILKGQYKNLLDDSPSMILGNA